ncbi:MAG TPA: LpqB family beta-propeller domain-containing protein [Nocardioides sp.]|nr:LpqB family beta-propeller domain-containing protein [Nocardioides sp.]
MRTVAGARALRAVVAGAACALLSGCVGMPTEGPVEVPQVTAEVDDVPGISFDPRPPRSGESPAEIVSGFLEAMKATPISTTVARQFLSSTAADAWVPEEQIITYNELGDGEGGIAVRIPMKDVNLYDARGSWQRTVAGRSLELGLVEEDGEWRIDELPDALVVPDSWFDDWYERVSLYFFDPTSEVLVPEPVFAPRGDQLASSLVRGLLSQPAGESVDVARTYFPPGTDIPSVPIRDGIAEVALSGDPNAVDQDTADRMLAQLVETLRQEPRINAVQLSVGGRAIGFGGNTTQTGLDVGSGYDPSDLASRDLFALDRGLVVSGTVGAFEPTLGPLGQQDYGVRSIGVDLAGSRVAAVSADGSALLSAPMEQPDGEVATVVSGAVDLAAPGWDYRDRIWVLDRGAGRSRVLTVVDGVADVQAVPGLSGRAVTQLLVSRDGSRLVAVVRGATSDRLVSLRVRHDSEGGIIGFTPPRTLPLPAEGGPRIRDVAWRSPTTVSVLNDLSEEGSQVRTLSVDGSPGEVTTGGATRLRGRIRTLVSAPVDTEVFAVAGRSVKSLTRPERSVPDLPSRLTSLTYPG